MPTALDSAEVSNTERKHLRARLMLIWGRTIEEHRIADFDTWLAKIAKA